MRFPLQQISKNGKDEIQAENETCNRYLLIASIRKKKVSELIKIEKEKSISEFSRDFFFLH